MIHILGVVGSPRIEGNTERVVAEALNAAKEDGAEIELLRLADRDIQPCTACLSCRKTGECLIRDDFNPIFEKMVQADGIILASPVYFSSATPQMKALIDRAGYLSVPGSTYWNVAFGRNRGDVDMDEEGLRTAWNLGKKMVWLISKIKGEY
jgi:multimeric flavodoxin WrbA